MKSTLLLFASLLLFSTGFAQNKVWQPANEGRLAGLEKTDRMAMPSAYHLFNVDLQQLKISLQAAPSRGSGITSGVIIEFPNAEGVLEHYRVYEASVMQPGLAAAHPELQSYLGQGIETPAATVRFSSTIFGLHAMIMSPKGNVYIDPYTKNLQNYIVYKKSDLVENRSFSCELLHDAPAYPTVKAQGKSAMMNDGKLRTYRLAMACTIEYAAYHISAAGLNSGTTAQKKAAVLAAMVVTVTRVDGVYEREVAVTMQLVDNNEDIIFVTTDSFNNNNANQLISQSQSVIDANIGDDNYDVGHTVSTGGGGLAQLGVVCTSGYKGMGITGSPAPVGDPYDIDYVAHEMGHEFNCEHTFNGVGGSCGGNTSNSTAVEPGSGTTIMAYAGICEAADVQAHSDDYFHAVSLAEIATLLDGTSCAAITTINNTEPVVPAITARTIPHSTAFVLRSGVATDVNGDALTYCWEQTNTTNTPVNLPSSTNTTGPNFRSFSPTTELNRYFPALADVVAGELYPTWEQTSDVARALTFALTVRDNNALGGQTTRKNVTITVNATAGPFVVTSQTEDELSWAQGSQQTITWDVAGTTANNVNTANVNILLSTDNGLTFTTVLASGTPNDGSETITVPTVLAPYCRIMVEAVGNVFYAVNTTTFAVGYAITNSCATYTNNTAVAIPDNSTAYSTSDINVPAGNVVTSVTVNVNITHPYIGNLILKAISPAATEVVLWQQKCTSNDDININFSDTGSNVVCASSELGNTYKPNGSLATFIGQNPTGNWSLAFADVVAQNTGTLNSWAVTICSTVFTPLSAAQFTLKDFTLYPNPNNGSFTVAFTSASQNNIAITVHDMRGRQIFANNYANTGAFSNNINLQNAETGVYMVTVQDGNRKEVRKVVVR